MNQEQLSASAVSFGFDPEWVKKIMVTWGDECLADVVEAARHGFSRDLITEVLQNFGPNILDLLVNLSNKVKLMGESADMVSPGGIVEGVNSAMIDILVEKWLPIIVQKYLPMIVEKYAPQIIQFVIDFLLKSLTK